MSAWKVDLLDFHAIWVLLLTCIFLGWVYHVWKNSYRNFPPGPMGLPLLGYTPFLKKEKYASLNELSKKYGDLFSLRLGSQPIIVLNSAEVTREVLQRDEFLGRCPKSTLKNPGAERPFFGCENEIWEEHKTFTLQSLRELGLGKPEFEEQIKEEIDVFLEYLGNCINRPIDLHMPISRSVANVIGLLICNKRYEYDDPEMEMVIANLRVVARLHFAAASWAFFPWLRRLPCTKWSRIMKEGTEALVGNVESYTKIIENHEKTLDPQNIRDIIDMYLLEMKFKKEKKLETTFSKDILVGYMKDLQSAGIAAPTVAMLWMVYVIAAHPGVQKRVQKEIENRLGPERKPDSKDRELMPFTNAVIMEVMRWKTVVPIPVLYSTTQDTTLRGFDIPKGTSVMQNKYNAHHDPKLWAEPDSFIPERFLSKDGQTVVNSPNYMPFSVGKRACTAQKLGSLEIFLYLVSLLQKFDIKFPKGYEPTFRAELGMVYSPEPFEVILTPRTS